MSIRNSEKRALEKMMSYIRSFILLSTFLVPYVFGTSSSANITLTILLTFLACILGLIMHEDSYISTILDDPNINLIYFLLSVSIFLIFAGLLEGKIISYDTFILSIRPFWFTFIIVFLWRTFHDLKISYKESRH